MGEWVPFRGHARTRMSSFRLCIAGAACESKQRRLVRMNARTLDRAVGDDVSDVVTSCTRASANE